MDAERIRAISEGIEQIRAIPDPVQRVSAVNAALAALAQQQSALAAITRDTVREMRKSMSYGQVAQALGVSKTRVQQLER